MRTFIIAIFLLLSFTSVVRAAEGDPLPPQSDGGGTSGGSVSDGGGTVAPDVQLINPLKSGTSLETFLGNILAFVVRIGTIVVILMLVYVGFLFVTARGEPGKITTAREALLWTVIGALVLLGAQAISMGILATVQALGG
jgi:heme/copper-type cytochrome/quinol oxidase subunit 2